MNLENYIKHLNEEIEIIEKYLQYLENKKAKLIVLKEYRVLLKHLKSQRIAKLTKEELMELLVLCKSNRDFLEGIKNDSERKNRTRQNNI